jgi:hypothetical protein
MRNRHEKKVNFWKFVVIVVKYCIYDATTIASQQQKLTQRRTNHDSSSDYKGDYYYI